MVLLEVHFRIQTRFHSFSWLNCIRSAHEGPQTHSTPHIPPQKHIRCVRRVDRNAPARGLRRVEARQARAVGHRIVLHKHVAGRPANKDPTIVLNFVASKHHEPRERPSVRKRVGRGELHASTYHRDRIGFDAWALIAEARRDVIEEVVACMCTVQMGGSDELEDG